MLNLNSHKSQLLWECELKYTCRSVCVPGVCKVWIHHSFLSFDMWLMGGESKAETSLLIRPDSPSPRLLTERLISYLHQSALSVWHQSIRMSNCSSPLQSKSVHPLDPIGHARQHHLVRTEEIKEEVSPSEVWPSSAASPSQNECKAHFRWVSSDCFISWSFQAVNLVVPLNLQDEYHCKGYERWDIPVANMEVSTKSSYELLVIYRLARKIRIYYDLGVIFIC